MIQEQEQNATGLDRGANSGIVAEPVLTFKTDEYESRGLVFTGTRAQFEARHPGVEVEVIPTPRVIQESIDRKAIRITSDPRLDEKTWFQMLDHIAKAEDHIDQAAKHGRWLPDRECLVLSLREVQEQIVNLLTGLGATRDEANLTA